MSVSALTAAAVGRGGAWWGGVRRGRARWGRAEWGGAGRRRAAHRGGHRLLACTFCPRSCNCCPHVHLAGPKLPHAQLSPPGGAGPSSRPPLRPISARHPLAFPNRRPPIALFSMTDQVIRAGKQLSGHDEQALSSVTVATLTSQGSATSGDWVQSLVSVHARQCQTGSPPRRPHSQF